MGTFAEDIEAEAGDEPIEAIVIGKFGYSWQEDNRAIPEDLLCRPLGWDIARPALDYEYDAGRGSSDCHPIAAYTATRVLFVSVYDGATEVESIPRHPGEFTPSMPGGQ